VTTQSIASALYVLGAVLAVAGPGIAAYRLIGKYRAAKQVQGTRQELNDSVNPAKVRATALRDAAWGVVEFSFVALGVVSASVASLILIP
jgi:hypothetical protein